MSAIKNLFVVAFMAAPIASCASQSAPITVADTKTRVTLSDCRLAGLTTTKDGQPDSDPEFERLNRLKTWSFRVTDTAIESSRGLPGRGSKSRLDGVPIVERRDDMVIAEGRTHAVVGRQTTRIELKGNLFGRGVVQVRQVQTTRYQRQGDFFYTDVNASKFVHAWTLNCHPNQPVDHQSLR